MVATMVFAEVEDFIKENKLDEMAARQLRLVDPQIQELVLVRGSLEGCRNPSAVIGARIRDAKEELSAKKEELTPSLSSSSTATANPMAMINPMMGMMLNPMMMMMMPAFCPM